jgi:hypothetical protein
MRLTRSKLVRGKASAYSDTGAAPDAVAVSNSLGAPWGTK